MPKHNKRDLFSNMYVLLHDKLVLKRLMTVKSFYQVEELGEGVSEDEAWGSLVR